MSDAAARIRELHAADAIAATLGIELLDAGSDCVRLQMAVDDRHVGWHGRCHGGVLFTAADAAMSYVSNREPGVAFAVQASIDFLAGAELGDVVVIEGRETANTGRAAVLDATLSVEGRVIAAFHGTTRRAR